MKFILIYLCLGIIFPFIDPSPPSGDTNVALAQLAINVLSVGIAVTFGAVLWIPKFVRPYRRTSGLTGWRAVNAMHIGSIITPVVLAAASAVREAPLVQFDPWVTCAIFGFCAIPLGLTVLILGPFVAAAARV